MLAASLIISAACAGDGECQKNLSCDRDGCAQRCGDCGCLNGCCNKVCRLKCEPKKVKVTCYKCESDCVPLPGPSPQGCRRVEHVDCDDKGGDDKSCKDGCGPQKKVVWFDLNLGGKDKGDCGGGNCRTAGKKKLMKKEVEVELKGAYEYKWEIVDLCKGCEDKALDKAPEVGPDAEVPPPPPVAARVISGKPVVERTVARNE
jgi:hypothetical protein